MADSVSCEPFPVFVGQSGSREKETALDPTEDHRKNVNSLDYLRKDYKIIASWINMS
jgi:hypothetical protein